MKKPAPKLTLHRETLHHLTDLNLRVAAGVFSNTGLSWCLECPPPTGT